MLLLVLILVLILVMQLLPYLKKRPGGRVVVVSSALHRKAQGLDLQCFEK